MRQTYRRCNPVALQSRGLPALYTRGCLTSARTQAGAGHLEADRRQVGADPLAVAPLGAAWGRALVPALPAHERLGGQAPRLLLQGRPPPAPQLLAGPLSCPPAQTWLQRGVPLQQQAPAAAAAAAQWLPGCRPQLQQPPCLVLPARLSAPVAPAGLLRCPLRPCWP